MRLDRQARWFTWLPSMGHEEPIDVRAKSFCSIELASIETSGPARWIVASALMTFHHLKRRHSRRNRRELSGGETYRLQRLPLKNATQQESKALPLARRRATVEPAGSLDVGPSPYEKSLSSNDAETANTFRELRS